MVDAAWNLILRTLNPCGSHSPPLAALIARVSETDVLLTTGRRLDHLYNTPPLGAGVLYLWRARQWRLDAWVGLWCGARLRGSLKAMVNVRRPPVNDDCRG